MYRTGYWIRNTIAAGVIVTIRLCLYLYFQSSYCDRHLTSTRFMNLLQSKAHYDSCHKCEDLRKIYRLCADRTDACMLCQRSKRIIFFTETSKRTVFDSKQACAIESASFHHPEMTVLVYVRAEKDCTANEMMRSVCALPNLQIINVDLVHDEDFIAAGFENFERDRLTKKTDEQLAHLSDVMRLVFMKKHGGFYLDLDIFVLKPLKLPYGIGHVMPTLLETAVMHLPPQSKLASVALKELNDTYTGKGTFLEAGPELVTRVIKLLCPGMLFEDPSIDCMGIRVYPKSYFYAIYWTDISLFYDNLTSSDQITYTTQLSFGTHIWNHVATTMKPLILPGVQQGISLLASRNCPKVFPNFAKFATI
ncbi:hypothetical protein BGZ83_005590 [Gryganskiella cystojenkinii]|nr:hypothetical protein BGZ83_005590 [Gryganskiella cystojenkinii]